MLLFLLPLLLAAASARAQGAPPLRVLMLPAMVPDAIREMLPIVLDAPGLVAGAPPQRVSIVAMVYCGGDTRGGANAVGVALPGTAASALAATALSANDCTAPLAGVAARLIDSGIGAAWLEALKIHATWTPWRLTLAIADAAGAARPGSSAPALRAGSTIASYDTSGIRLLTGPGNNIAFDVAVGFAGTAITVVAAPAGRIGIPERYLNDPAIAGEIASAPAMSNVIVDAQYTFINQILRLYNSTFDIPLPVEGVTETMTARNITVTGAENLMTVAGDLGYRGLDYASSLRCEGADLAVKQVTLDAPAPNCNQANLVERMQCEGQSVAVYGSAKALAAAITTYYEGRPLHVSTSSQPLDFAVGATAFQATFEALKSSSHGATFGEAGRVSIRRAGGGS